MVGLFSFLPLGTMLLNNIINATRTELGQAGFFEISVPILQDYEWWRQSGRAEAYAGTLFTTGETGGSYVVAPTHEEQILMLASKYNIENQKLFRIGECVRNELRPAYGLVRAKSFTQAGLYIVGRSETDVRREVDRLHCTIDGVLQTLNLDFRKAENVRHPERLMMSYWIETEMKQCVVMTCEHCGKSYRGLKLQECPKCQKTLTEAEGLELADICFHGNTLAKKLGLGDDLYLATAGIGISRILQVVAERQLSPRGFVWPDEVAPFNLEIVMARGREEEVKAFSSRLANASSTRILVDMRNQPMGRKLIDADLIGARQLIFGSRSTMVEVRNANGTITFEDTTKLLEILSNGAKGGGCIHVEE